MPWFRHHYHCADCDGSWLAEAALVLENDCPFCGARDTFPYKSDDWTLLVEQDCQEFVVLEASPSAQHQPDYRKRKTFATRAEAEAYIADRLILLAKRTFSLTMDRLKKSA